MTEVWEIVGAEPVYTKDDKIVKKIGKYVRKAMIQIKDELHFQSTFKYVRIPLTGTHEIIVGSLKPDKDELMDKDSNFRGMTPSEIQKKAYSNPSWFRKNQDIILQAYKKGYAQKYEPIREKHKL